MSRTIKLRAWDKNQNIMMSMQDLLIGDGLYLIFSEKRAISGLIPMEFTGLTDKNGKEIFEGDIINAVGMKKIYEEDSKVSVVIMSKDLQYVIQDSREADFGLPLTWGGWGSLEVIGNIYENPELLK